MLFGKAAECDQNPISGRVTMLVIDGFEMINRLTKSALGQ